METPDEFSGFVNGTGLIGPENACSEDFCAPPCYDGVDLGPKKQLFFSEKNSYHQAKSAYKTAITNGNSTLAAQEKDIMVYHRQEMSELGYTILSHALLDTTTYHQDTIKVWLGNIESFVSEMELAGMYHRDGNFATSNSILFNAPNKLELNSEQLADLENFGAILNLLAGHDIHKLPHTVLGKLELFAALSSSPHASGTAKNILGRYGRKFDDENCEHTAKRYQSTRLPHLSSPETGASSVRVYPNPSSGQLTFEWFPQKIDEWAVLNLIDSRGKQIWQANFSPTGNTVLKLDNGQLPAGSYFYQLTSSSGTASSGKFVILH